MLGYPQPGTHDQDCPGGSSFPGRASEWSWPPFWSSRSSSGYQPMPTALLTTLAIAFWTLLSVRTTPVLQHLADDLLRRRVPSAAGDRGRDQVGVFQTKNAPGNPSAASQNARRPTISWGMPGPVKSKAQGASGSKGFIPLDESLTEPHAGPIWKWLTYL